MPDRNLPLASIRNFVRLSVNAPARIARKLAALKNRESLRWRQKAQLAKLEKTYGRIDSSTRKQIRTHAREVLGSEHYWLSLALNTAVAGEFRQEWIPAEYRRRHVDRVASGHIFKVSGLKTLTRRLLPEAPLPDIGYFSNGIFISANGEPRSSSDFFKEISRDHDRIIFKGDASFGARSVIVLNSDQFDTVCFARFGSGVFQRFVSQHEDLAAVSPGPVASLRILTWLDESGQVTTRGSILRMGRRGQPHVGAGERFVSGVDSTTGCLNSPGYDANWKKFEKHPDTGVVFDGHPLPSFPATVELAQRLHAAFPYVRLIGWDFAVEEDGSVVVFEWNFNPGLEVTEALGGPCFAGLGWENYWRNPRRTT